MRWYRGRSKYNAKRTEINGIKFASKREGARYEALLLELKAGRIMNLTLQPKYELQPAFDKNGVHYRPIKYIGDFLYTDNKGNIIVEDSKGFRKDKVFLMKQKMFEFVFKDLHLNIV